MITEKRDLREPAGRQLPDWGMKILVVAGLAVMTPLTILALWQHGMMGIFSSAVSSSASLQIFADLVVACLLASAWLWNDSRRNARRFLPWFLLTLVAGSFGPLIYLLMGMLKVNGQADKKSTPELSDEVTGS